MKVSTTSFLLASLYGSALAAPVSGAPKGVTSPAGLGNVVPRNGLTKGLTGAVGQPGSIVGDLVGGAPKGVTSPAGLGNIVPGNGSTKGLTGAVGQPGRVVARDAPIGGALQSVTGTTGLGNVVPRNDLAKGLTGAVGQPGSIVGRDGEQKATAVLPNGQLVATDNTADVDIRADAPNVHARNLDAEAKGIVGDVHAWFHPLKKPPVDINAVANVDARNVDATSVGDQPDDATATGSAEFAGETGTYGDVSSPTGGPARPTGNL